MKLTVLSNTIRSIGLMFCFSLFFSSVIVFGNGGIGYKGLKLNLKGTTSWYNIHGLEWGYQGCGDYGSTFYNSASENWQGTDLGTFSTTHTMEIIDFSVIGWTDNADYLAGKLEYKIWLQSDPEPAFWSQVSIGNYQFPVAGVADVACESVNDRAIAYNWNGAASAIDIQPGVAGTYNFKVKGFGRMQYTGGGGGSFNDNNGSELTATFTIVECSTGSVSASHTSILRGNDITWTYTGSYFDSYEYQWNSTAGTWNENFSTSNPHSWGSECPGCAPGRLYIRSKLVCAGDAYYTDPVSTYWDDCWVEEITTTVDGVSIGNGGDFTINSTVEWTWLHDGTGISNGAPNEGGGSGHALGYYWESDPVLNEDYVYAWGSNPQSWSDNAGSNFTTDDRKLYVKSRATGDNSCTNYSSPFYITLKKPTITASAISGSMTACGGLASSSETFTLSGQYIASTSNGSAASQGITVTAPTHFEVSTDNSSFSDNLNVSTADGTIASTTIYVRMKSSATGTPSGNVVCSATSANSQNVAVSGTVSSTPAAPTGSASQNFCSASTVSDLTATGSSIQWYAASSGGAALATNTALVDATSYYASQTVGGCESTDRLAVTASVASAPAAPTGSASQDFCISGTISDLSATGSSIQWYAASSGGSPLSAGSSLSDGTTYYASQTVSGCESTDRFAATANILSSGTWIGETSTDWATAANWCGGVPSSSTSVVIPSGTTYSPAIGASANAADVTINSGATLTISGSNTLTLADGGSFTNNGTFTGSSSGILFSGSATLTGSTTFNDLTINGALNPGSGTTINGTLTINSGGSISTNSPSYGSSSTLVYNTGGAFSRGLEWNASSGAGYPNNVTVSNSTTIDYPGIGGGSFSSNLQIGGTLTIDAGSSLYMDYGAGTASSQLTISGDIIANGNLSLGDAIGGDLKIGGSWTRGASSTFNSNSRAVYFIGTGTSSINGNGGETFTYMINEKSSGSIQLASNLTVSAPNGGNALTHNSAASIDLNGNTLYLNNAAASTLLADGGARTITGSGTISISGGVKTIGTANSGTLSFGSNVTIALAGGIDFGSSVSTVDGTLQINSGGYVSTNAPSYGSSALLHYNTGSSYNRSVEWVNTSSSGSGVPQNLQVGAGTSLVYGANSNTDSGITSYINGDLTVDGTFYHSDGGSNDAAGTLVVSGNITAAGTIQIGSGTLDCDGTFDATGGNVTYSGSGNLKLGGSVTSFGTITQGSGKITYDGGNQTVLALNGNGTTGSYEYLEIAGTGTKTLAGPTKVYGDLILTSGNFDLVTHTLYPNMSITRSSGNLVASGAADISFGTGSTHNICAFSDVDITINTTGTTTKTITTTGNIDCKTIDLSNPNSTFVVDGETVTLDIQLDIEEGTFQITSGTLNLDDNTADACILVTSTAFLDIDGGTINIGESGFSTGDIEMTDGTIDVSGGVLNIADELDVAGGTITQSGGIINIKSYTGGGNGTSANKFDMAAGTLNLTGGTLNLNGQVNNASYTAMTLASGVTLNATTGHTTVIKTNDLASEDEDMYIDLNGKSLGNVTVDLNGHDLYLNNNLNILGTLTLTGGLVQLGNKQLSIGVNGSSDGDISGGSSSSYIVADLNGGDPGKLIRNINSSSGTYNFPIGDLSVYAPMTITFTSGTLSNASVEAYTSPNRITGMSATLERRLNRSWTVEPTGISSPNYTISYTYDGSEVVGDAGFDLVPLKLSGGQWYKPSNSVISSGTAIGTFTDVSNVFTWSGLTSFSEFGGGGGGSPLPVELSSFTASCQDNGVLLHWITESEQNSSHFDVEKSYNGLDWNVITTLEGAGNSTESIDYTHLDLDKSMLEAYYRLNQVDVDGANKFYGPIHIYCDNEGVRAYSFPNPSKDGFQLILQKPRMLGEAQLTITDLNGKPVLEKIISIEEGINLYQYSTSNWSPGLYNIHVKGRNSEVYLKHSVE